MAKRKKSALVIVDIKLPVEMLAFYEGVAARTGLTISEVINVVLAINLAQGKPTDGPK